MKKMYKLQNITKSIVIRTYQFKALHSTFPFFHYKNLNSNTVFNFHLLFETLNIFEPISFHLWCLVMRIHTHCLAYKLSWCFCFLHLPTFLHWIIYNFTFFQYSVYFYSFERDHLLPPWSIAQKRIGRTKARRIQEHGTQPSSLLMSSEDPRTCVISGGLPVCTLQGRWNWKWSQHSLQMGRGHLKQGINFCTKIPALLSLHGFFSRMAV